MGKAVKYGETVQFVSLANYKFIKVMEKTHREQDEKYADLVEKQIEE